MSKRAERLGCVVAPSSSGRELTFRFRLRGPDGQLKRYRERTGFPDTPANRAKLEQHARLIGEEIRLGIFRYEIWFPQSVKRRELREQQLEFGPWRTSMAPVKTYAERYERWILQKKSDRDAGQCRPSLITNYEQHWKDHLKAAFGPLRWRENEPSHQRLERFRVLLRAKVTKRGKTLDEKTIRNIIDSTLRAFIRDAWQDDLPATLEGFAKMRWKRYVPPDPTPFPEDARDRLLEYLRTKHFRTAGELEARLHYPYYAYAATLFFSALRPSEAAAAKLRHVDLSSTVGKILIRASRHRGNENDPKTTPARREAKLLPELVEILRPLIPLKADPDLYLFRDMRGQPIKPENYYHVFRDAQRAIGLTPIRDLYSTKDTYISWARRLGVDEGWLEDQTGVSAATQKKHYRGSVDDDEWDQSQLDKMSRRTVDRKKISEEERTA